MAVKLTNKTNVESVSAENPYGKVKDNTGSNDGTPVNVELVHDALITFEKMMDEAGVTHNGIEDNEYDGFQYYEAFRKLTKPYKVYHGIIAQSGTSAPTVVTMGENEIGSIVWTRTGVGNYLGTLAGAFSTQKTQVFVQPSAFGSPNATMVHAGFLNSNQVGVKTFDDTGAAADGLLVGQCSIEIRVFD